MAGKMQAHLIECSDGEAYVVKFPSHLVHTRLLINEFIAHHILRELDVPTPEMALVKLDDEFLHKFPDILVRSGSMTAPPDVGLSLGSHHLGHRSKRAVYDWLPDSLIGKLSNASDFLGAYVFDKWTSNMDSRQSVVVRTSPSSWLDLDRSSRLTAVMIDHAEIFNGQYWNFTKKMRRF